MPSKVIAMHVDVHVPPDGKIVDGMLMETSNGIQYVEIDGWGLALDKEKPRYWIKSDGNDFYVLQGLPTEEEETQEVVRDIREALMSPCYREDKES